MSKQFSLVDGARRLALATGLMVATLAVGCGESDDSEAREQAQAEELPQAATAADWCAVKKIMDKSCVFCHDGEGTAGSPMGLSKLEDFYVQSPLTPTKKVYETVQERMNNRSRPMPPRGLLPAADLAVVNAWVAAGAPKECGGAATPAADAGTPAADAGPVGLDAGVKADAGRIDAVVRR